MHAALGIGDEELYLSDTFPGMKIKQGNAIEINITPGSEAELRSLFDKHVTGGKVQMPIEKMFWGSLFGSLTDKFGIGWNLDYELKSE